jgi:signal transduction histidine kinase/FixJ family two-component response regulator
MNFSPLKSRKRRDYLPTRLVPLAAVACTGVLTVTSALGLLRPLHTMLGAPVEFHVREKLQVSPHVSSRLKILILDDSTYARMQKPYLSGDDWAGILSTIGQRQPRAIVTNHMFGTGEFSSGDDLLSNTLKSLKKDGVAVITGAFATPATISFRNPLGPDIATRDLPPKARPVVIPQGKFYGPEAGHAREFTAIGHLAYDGTGRIPAFQSNGQMTLAHIGYATAISLGLPTPVTANADGYETVNLPAISSLVRASKSLKNLMGSDGAVWSERLIQPDDVVLILADMYTGKANFVSTPLGTIPSGYIVASALNSMLTGLHLRDRSDSWIMVVIFLILGLSCGLAPGATWFAVSFACGLVLIPCIGLLSFAVTGVIMPWISASLFFAIPAAGLFFRRTQVQIASIQARTSQAEKESEKLNAIVRTAQMFAHDVRKPFSMLNMTAQSIQKVTDTSEIIRFLNRMLPELERSMAAVEGMIHDIMEIDSRAAVSREDTVTTDFILDCLRDTFVLRQTRDVALDFDLNHSMALSIDRQKIRRVLINIIDNAVSAMNGKGRMWISTCDATDHGLSFVEITIGNSGSWIEPENLQRIFEAFYTRGKKGGTGLGLAIAQKVVLEHGGSISARSGKGGDAGNGGNQAWTEFVFTLPVAFSTPSQHLRDLPLPKSSAAFLDAQMIPRRDDESEAKAGELDAASDRLRLAVKNLQRPVRVLVIDDEVVYLESMKAILSGGVFSGIIRAETAASSDEALTRAVATSPDIILCDIDMGPASLSGFEIVERLRHEGVQAWIIMHSNRIFQRDSSRARAAGANHFLPKPVSELKLMTAIADGLQPPSVAAPPVMVPTSPDSPRDVVVVVDDDVFTLEAWEAILDDATVRTFSSPSAFWEYLSVNKTFVNDIKMVVTDYYFDNEDGVTGESFARMIKQVGPIPVLLSSNGSFTEVPAVFDAVIAKEPDTWSGLTAKLTKVKAS